MLGQDLTLILVIGAGQRTVGRPVTQQGKNQGRRGLVNRNETDLHGDVLTEAPTSGASRLGPGFKRSPVLAGPRRKKPPIRRELSSLDRLDARIRPPELKLSRYLHAWLKPNPRGDDHA